MFGQLQALPIANCYGHKGAFKWEFVTLPHPTILRASCHHWSVITQTLSGQVKYAVHKFHSRRDCSELTGSPSSKYVVYVTACVYRELYGKITDRKKNCVNNYLIWNKVFLPQMCRELVSCADFKPFLRRLVKLFEAVTPLWCRIIIFYLPSPPLPRVFHASQTTSFPVPQCFSFKMAAMFDCEIRSNVVCSLCIKKSSGK